MNDFFTSTFGISLMTLTAHTLVFLYALTSLVVPLANRRPRLPQAAQPGAHPRPAQPGPRPAAQPRVQPGPQPGAGPAPQPRPGMPQPAPRRAAHPTPPPQPPHRAAQPAPGPARTEHGTPQPADERTTFINVLLGVAVLFILAAAFIFVGVSQHALARIIALWVTAGLTYGSGLILYRLAPRLRPVGVALTCIGLALIPIAGAALGALGLTGARLAWFVCSLAGSAAFALAAWLMRSALVSWFGLVFAASTVLSCMSVGTPRFALSVFAFYGTGLALVSACYVLLGRLLRSRVAADFVRPYAVLGHVLAGVSFVAAGLSLGADLIESGSPWDSAACWLALTVFYTVVGLCRSWAYALPMGQLTFTLAAAQAAAALVPGPGWEHGYARHLALLSTATVLISLNAALSKTLRARGLTVTLFTALGLTGLLAAIETALISFSLSTHSPTWAVVLFMAVLVLTGAAGGWAAWATDFPLMTSLSLGAMVTAVITAASHLNSGIRALDISITVLGGLLTALGAATLFFLVRTPLGRSRPALRSASAVLTGFAALVGTLPMVRLAWMHDPGHAGVVLVACSIAGLVIAAAAFALRSSPTALAIIPTAHAGSSAAAVRGQADTQTDLFRVIFTSAIAIAVIVLLLMSHSLHRRGRARRAVHAESVGVVFAASLAPTAFAFPLTAHMTQASTSAYLLGVSIIVLIVTGMCSGIAHQLRTSPQPARPHSLFSVCSGPLVLAGILMFCAAVSSFFAHPLAAAAAFTIMAAAAAGLSFALGSQWIQLAAGFAVWVAVFAGFRDLLDDLGARALLASWIAWAVSYGAHWVLTALRRPRLAALVAAFFALATAVQALPAVNLSVPWIRSPRQVAAGITLGVAALMLAFTVRVLKNRRHQMHLSEGASYVGAASFMIGLGGIGTIRFSVLWHCAVAVAVLWALLWQRHLHGTVRLQPGFSVPVDLRLILPFALLTLAGAVDAIAHGQWYTLLFLADHTALLIFGALFTRGWAVWWGLAAIVFGILWGLRSLLWLGLIIMALVLIGVVVWMLLRPKKPTAAAPGPPKAPGTPAHAPGAQPSAPGQAAPRRPANPHPHFPAPPGQYPLPPNQGPAQPPAQAPGQPAGRPNRMPPAQPPRQQPNQPPQQHRQ